MNRRLITLIVAVVIIVGSALAFVAIYDSRHPATSSTQGGQTASSNTNGGSSSQPPSGTARTFPIAVYFSRHPDSDDDPAKTFPVARISPNSGVAAAAIKALLTGPTSAETNTGYFTTAHLRPADSNCSGQDFKLTIKSGTATLRFCKPFDHLGVVADGQAESEINATLKQFATIKKIIILDSQGNCEFNASGMNLCLQ